jgi:NADH-quinone oxidoreductase subunit N
VLSSIVAVFFYVRLIVLMFFVDGEGEVAGVARPSLLTAGTILVGAAATLLLGVVPGPVLTLAAHAGEFIR